STNNLEKNMKSRFAQLNFNISIAITIFLLGSIALIAGASPSQKSSPPAFSPASTLPRILDGRVIHAHAYGLLDAAVTTDKGDYHPGEIVHISGSGFAAGETVQLDVDYKPNGTYPPFRPESAGYASGHYPWDVTADGDG